MPSKISNFMAVLLVAVAAIFDVADALINLLDLTVVGVVVVLVINDILSIIAVILFFIWLKMLNVSFVDPKRAIRFFGSFFAQLIPAINALPVWIFGICLTIATVWLEEAIQKYTGIKLAINAHLAVGNPNPVSKFSDFAKNPKGFANNLDKLGHSSGTGDMMKLRNIMNDEKASRRAGNKPWKGALPNPQGAPAVLSGSTTPQGGAEPETA